MEDKRKTTNTLTEKGKKRKSGQGASGEMERGEEKKLRENN